MSKLIFISDKSIIPNLSWISKGFLIQVVIQLVRGQFTAEMINGME